MTANPLQAAAELHRFLSARKIPYAVIGGLAVQYWGEPRFTRDVDVTVLLAEEDHSGFLADTLSAFTPRVSDPEEFAARTRMILLTASDGCEIDISLGLPGYEEEVVRRAVEVEFLPGSQVKLCSPEDLVIHKVVAGRPRDIDDVRSVVFRQGSRLDLAYIREWLGQFAQALDRPDLPAAFETPLGEWQDSDSKA